MSKFNYYTHYEVEVFDRIPLPRIFFTHEMYQNLSLEAKVLYSFLWERTSESVEKGWQDEDSRNFVYFPQQEVQEVFNVSSKKASKMMDELDSIGLIQRKRQGLGLPTKIYVLNFATLIDQSTEQYNTANLTKNYE